MLKLISALLLIALLLLANNCDLRSYDDAKRDSSFNFCTTLYVQDLTRIPLIEPFELISTNDGYSWFFEDPKNLFNNQIPILTSDLTEVGVDFPYIAICYNNLGLSEDGVQKKGIILFNVKSNEIDIIDLLDLEKKLDSYYLAEYNLPLYPIEDVYQDFAVSTKLPWKCE